MMHAGKNIENRDATVAARLAPFVGQNIGISQSKSFDWVDYEATVLELKSRGLVDWPYRESLRPDSDVNQSRGKLILVARLDRIAKPSEYGRSQWHVQGQHGLVLSNVRQIEPVPCRGAVGAWKPYWCASCGAISAAGKSMQCAHCKSGEAYSEEGDRPLLKVVRVCQ
jgi:hypothetical protein